MLCIGGLKTQLSILSMRQNTVSILIIQNTFMLVHARWHNNSQQQNNGRLVGNVKKLKPKYKLPTTSLYIYRKYRHKAATSVGGPALVGYI